MSWKAIHYGYKNDDRAFIFSMDRKQIYRHIKDNGKIYCHTSYGPSFGYIELSLQGDPLNKEDRG